VPRRSGWIHYDPYSKLYRVPKTKRKKVPMPPGHGRLTERLIFERTFIEARMKFCPPKPEIGMMGGWYVGEVYISEDDADRLHKAHDAYISDLSLAAMDASREKFCGT
jgi:hypothetical protein